MAAEDWGEEKFIPRGRSTVKNEERGGGRGVKRRLFSPPPPPTSTVHSDCKSKMAGRTNDRELLALARTNKTPALQGNRAQEEQISVGHFKSLQNKQKE